MNTTAINRNSDVELADAERRVAITMGLVIANGFLIVLVLIELAEFIPGLR